MRVVTIYRHLNEVLQVPVLPEITGAFRIHNGVLCMARGSRTI